MSGVSWKETVNVIWETFTGVRSGGSARLLRTFAFVLLAAGTLFAVSCHARVAGIGRRPEKLSGAAGNAAGAVRPQGVTERARSVHSRRMGSYEFTGIAGAGGDLFVHPADSEKTPPPAASDAPAAAPDITVRGVMALGGRSVAMVDIRGGETGKIVKAGDSFACMGHTGRVTRVSGRGVSVRWNGLDLNFPLN